MNAKAKGNRIERKCIQLLESVGYSCIRSAASLGAFDIIAVNRLGVRCIQVKANDWPRPPEREVMQIAALNLPANATVECWRWNDGEKTPIIKALQEF
mgnify:CR=1 FL=1